jgi:hypothetical protein
VVESVLDQQGRFAFVAVAAAVLMNCREAMLLLAWR